MKALLASILLISAVANAAHITVKITPENIAQYDISVSVVVVEQIFTPDNDFSSQVTGHIFNVTVKSQNINLVNCRAYISLSTTDKSLLQTAMERDSLALNDGFIFTSATLSPDYADSTFIDIKDFNRGASFSYRLKLTDWIKISEHAPPVHPSGH